MKLTRSIAKIIYLSGLALYVVSLFLPAYSPLGIWNESGWDALKFVLNIDFNAVKQINSIVQVLNFAVLMLSALNSVLVVILIGLFPIRRYFNNKRWFKIIVVAAILSLVYVTIMLIMAEEIVLRYGFYIWCVSITLIYASFHPKLSSSK